LTDFIKEERMSRTLTRRSVITGGGAAVAAVALGSAQPSAQAPAGRFQPARHQQDAWLDAVAGKHRNFIDASTVRGAAEAVLYANNLFEANKNGYTLSDGDVAVVVCMRHFATPFAFTDAMWAKYGTPLCAMLEFSDPKSKRAPSTNLLNSGDYGMAMPNLGNTIPAVTKRGVQFAVCDMATHFLATQLAAATSGNADTIYKDLSTNLIPNSHMVAAGVVAVNRAQEYGYTLLSTL
jgi:intracellular sulfur oxidation DsrE/DsrF family protein